MIKYHSGVAEENFVFGPGGICITLIVEKCLIITRISIHPPAEMPLEKLGKIVQF